MIFILVFLSAAEADNVNSPVFGIADDAQAATKEKVPARLIKLLRVIIQSARQHESIFFDRGMFF